MVFAGSSAAGQLPDRRQGGVHIGLRVVEAQRKAHAALWKTAQGLVGRGGTVEPAAGENPKFLRERLMTFMNQKAREGGSGEDAQEGRKKRRGK